ncbi:MAG: Ig-like domain-containing protein [Polyangiaceae bacterium]|nr:Ig-like domain-containing protein [Polyangiaceae bacterium]
MGPPLRVFATVPASGGGEITRDVPLDASIRLRFDRYLLPETAVRQSLLVTGGSFAADGGAPIAGAVSFQPDYDPLTRTVVYRPQGTYQPGTLYTVILRKPSEEDNGFGFRAWDGAELERTVTFQFETTLDPSKHDPPSPSGLCGVCSPTQQSVDVGGKPTTVSSAPGRTDEQAMLTLGGCAYGGCHAGSQEAPAGVLGLDLSSYDAIQRTALSRTAVQTLRGPTATAERSAALFGVGMPRIDPGNPGNSYLLYKVLVGPELFSPDNGAGPAAADGLAEGERERLRAFVSGEAMPLDADPAREGTLGFGEAAALSRWIAAGAPATCEQPARNCACGVQLAPAAVDGVKVAAGAGGGGGSSGGGGAAGSGGATCDPARRRTFAFWDAAASSCTEVQGCACTNPTGASPNPCTLSWRSCAEAEAACKQPSP